MVCDVVQGQGSCSSSGVLVAFARGLRGQGLGEGHGCKLTRWQGERGRQLHGFVHRQEGNSHHGLVHNSSDAADQQAQDNGQDKDTKVAPYYLLLA